MSQKASKRNKKESQKKGISEKNIKMEVEKTNGNHSLSDNAEPDLIGFKSDGNVIEAKNKSLETQEVPEGSTNGHKNESIQDGEAEVSTESETKVEIQNEEDAVNANESESLTEMEPLALDVEEPDPELDFDESSDIDSLKESPVINRCITRRSQTRNIPTPKTPKSIIDQNGEDKVSGDDKVNGDDKSEDDKKSEVSVSAAIAFEAAENDLEDMSTAATANSSEVGSTISERTESDSLGNLSTKAVAGGDTTTRDLDFTFTETAPPECKPEPLVNPYKEKLGEGFRRLTSRRTIRGVSDYRKYALKTTMEKANADDGAPLAARSSVERLSGMKRKNDSESPERAKKTKTGSPGLFSMITSPIGNLRMRFSRTQLPTSTPKLTGFKSNENDLERSDVSEFAKDTKQTEEPNKWCTIM